MLDTQTIESSEVAQGGPGDDDDPKEPEREGPRRRFPWGMLVVATSFVIAAFLSWYGSWFGRPLSDNQIESYFSDRDKPRNVQHALSYIGNRIIEGNQGMKRWYPQVIVAAEHPAFEVRQTAAWAMGQDNTYPEFHRALLQLLQDTHPAVRHNAALQLVRFNDPAARPELVRMLEPHVLRAESDGTVEFIIKEEGRAVPEGAPLVRIRQGDGQKVEIHAPEDGRVELLAVSDGASVEAGREVMILGPSTEQVWESLRALYIVGRPEDIPYIERYTRRTPGVSDHVNKQAVATLESIRARAGQATSDK